MGATDATPLFPHIKPNRDDVVASLVQHGVHQAEAERLVDNNHALWDGGVTDELRWEWIQSTSYYAVQAQNDASRAHNQVDASHAFPSADEVQQQVLTLAKAQGFYSGRGIGTHEWGDAERAAVSEYQRRRGLTVTGTVDQATTMDVASVGRFLAAPSTAAGPAAFGPPVGTGHGGPRPGESAAPTGGPTAPASTAAPSASAVAAATSTGTTASSDLGGTPNPDGLFGIPGGAEIWHVDGKDWYAVYRVPGTGTPLAWRIDPEDLAAVFGPNRAPVADKTYTGLEAFAQGPLVFGSTRLLANTSEHPFDAFTANFQTEAATRPWLRDPEILALTTRALLENRTVTDAELAGTKWWQNHTAAERAWIAQYNSDPATARQQIQDTRDLVKRTMIAAGIANAPDKIANLIADRITGGTWTQAYANTQITKLADPAAPGNLDPTLRTWVTDWEAKGSKLDTLVGQTSKVEQIARTWLGPAFAQTWTQAQLESWAGRLRNDPQAEEELIKVLKGQRMSLFPEYTDENRTYEDIAAPWRGVWTQLWGEQPDETDPLFSQIVRSNDLGSAQEILRKEGLRRNNVTITNNLLAGIGRSDLGAGAVRGVV